MSRTVTVRLPDELAAWLRRQGSQTETIRLALTHYREGGGRPPEARDSLTPERRGEGVSEEAPSPDPTKNVPVRTKTVTYVEDGYEYEREVPIP